MQPPLFVWEPNELLAFETVEALERFIEPFDLDVERSFDAAGRLLSITADGARTVVREAESEPSHQDELRAALIAVLSDAEEEGVRSAPLEDLVARAATRFAVPQRPSLMNVIKALAARRPR